MHALPSQYDFAKITRCLLGSPVKIHVPGPSAEPNGMHRIVTLQIFLVDRVFDRSRAVPVRQREPAVQFRFVRALSG